jgi:D-alanine-D-alanine ligase-like ATP-grasp enzyme
MKILVLHSDVSPDAPPDDQDTLLQAAAIAATLGELGHDAVRAAFTPDLAALEALLDEECPELVFNLVETVWGRGLYAPLAPQMLSQLGVPFTGAGAASIAACSDKIMAKRHSGLATLQSDIQNLMQRMQNRIRIVKETLSRS